MKIFLHIGWHSKKADLIRFFTMHFICPSECFSVTGLFANRLLVNPVGSLLVLFDILQREVYSPLIVDLDHLHPDHVANVYYVFHFIDAAVSQL